MKKLKEIDRLKALIDAGRPLSAEVVSELKRRNDVYISYSSTAIEGYGASRSETAIILESDTVIPGHKLSDAKVVAQSLVNSSWISAYRVSART